MIVARQEFQAKYGRGDELVALFKDFHARMGSEEASFSRARILTDATGRFFTVVTEYEVESLAAWESGFASAMAKPWMGEWFANMVELVETGSREFYNVVE